MTWPALPYEEWRETKVTLHMWTQVVGKIRLALTPLTNHWWNVPLYVTGRGLTTSAIHQGEHWFDAEFDFLADQLILRTDGGQQRTVALAPRSVADFYRETMAAVRSLGFTVDIWTTPVEVPDPIPFEKDDIHAAYDREYVLRFWQALALSEKVFAEFRSRFLGKCSPIHFFWGSFDLAVTRFSGRPAPPREGADLITREAYSHEVSSVGWWPGDERLGKPAFYSYAAPEPDGFRDAAVTPPATYIEALGGFYLLYEDVRTAPDPESMLLDFCQTTYEAAATLGQWDRKALER